MEQLDIFGNTADSDSDRPVKRVCTSLLLDQLDPVNLAAFSADPISSEREPPFVPAISFNTPNSCSSLFGRQGLSNLTTWEGLSILTASTPTFGSSPANLDTLPPTEQQPGIINTTPVSEISISDTSAARPCLEPSTTSNDLLADNAPVSGPVPGAGTPIFGFPPTVTGTETLLAKRDEPTIKQEGGNTVGQEPKQELSRENTTETAQLKVEEDSAVDAHIESFDDHGDLTLIVGEAHANFLVCSYSLRRVSATWHDRLYGPHSNPKVKEGEHDWVVCLPDDDPDAMRIILRVVHGNLSEIPAVLSVDMLFHLTATCDRHDMMGLLKPCWRGWVQKLPKPTFHPTTFARQIWIAHKLGHLEWYRGTLAEFLCNTQKDPSGKLFSEDHLATDFYNDPCLQELGLLKDCEDGRLKIIEVVGDILREALSRLANPQATTCYSGKTQENCDCAMLGGVHRALHGKHWYSGGAPHWEKDVAISVRALVTKMEGIRTTAIGESRMKKKNNAHKACSPWAPFALVDILRVCPIHRAVPIDRAAFKEQAKKTGLDVQPTSALARPENGLSGSG